MAVFSKYRYIWSIYILSPPNWHFGWKKSVNQRYITLVLQSIHIYKQNIDALSMCGRKHLYLSCHLNPLSRLSALLCNVCLNSISCKNLWQKSDNVHCRFCIQINSNYWYPCFTYCVWNAAPLSWVDCRCRFTNISKLIRKEISK